MANSDRDMIRLIGEYLCGDIGAEDQKALMEWVEKSEDNRAFFEEMCTGRTFGQYWELRKQIDTAAAIRKFDRRTSRSSGTFRIGNWLAYAGVAAAVLIVLTLPFLFSHAPEIQPVDMTQTEILPGSSKAVLVLAEGEQIKLTGEEIFRMNSGTGKQIVSRDQQLVYENGTSSVAEYNELRVPRGGEYRVVLSDGSVVRLNSGSSLKYPVTFSSYKREVGLTGEAYFEVAASATPFLVRVGDMTVKVYGTAFNINTHTAGLIRTALVEGKIGITVKGKTGEFLLAPSELADFNTSTGAVDICRTDLSPYLAWTNGLFIFNNETLDGIMNTLSLWYDVDVFYQNADLKKLHFTGCVKRYDRIDNILKALSQSVGVRFDQQGKALTLSN